MGEDEVVSVQDAARRIGRTVDTLRRWRRAGVIAFEPGTDEKGRALVRMGPLLAAAAGHAKETRPRAPLAQTPAPALPPSIGAAAVQGELDAVRRHLASVEAERDRALAEAKEARTELREARARLQSVEKELNGGVRGLLKRSFFR